MKSLTFDFSFLMKVRHHSRIFNVVISVLIALITISCGLKKGVLVTKQVDVDIPTNKIEQVEVLQQEAPKHQFDWGEMGIERSQKDNAALYAELEGWIGVPYVFAGHDKTGTDCSGLVMEVYLAVYEKKLNRNSRKMCELDCEEIQKNELKEADLVFFSSRADKVINHVGIYLKNGKFIHAGSKGVTVNDMNERYYETHYICSGRVKF